MTDDSKPIRDRGDKTPDHEVRGALVGATIKDVHHVLAPGGVTTATSPDADKFEVLPPRDTLYLVREDGSAIEIEAERLYLDLIPDYEAQLDAIRIEVID